MSKDEPPMRPASAPAVLATPTDTPAARRPLRSPGDAGHPTDPRARSRVRDDETADGDTQDTRPRRTRRRLVRRDREWDDGESPEWDPAERDRPDRDEDDDEAAHAAARRRSRRRPMARQTAAPVPAMPIVYNLDRFLTAQARDFTTAIAELKSGYKATHWIWYVFPQLAVLGRSATAKLYGIASREEAAAYMAHPVLGPRLVEAAAAALSSGVTDPHALFGTPDDLKVRSSLTLFLDVAPGEAVLQRALDIFYGGEKDPLTLVELEGPDEDEDDADWDTLKDEADTPEDQASEADWAESRGKART